MYWIYTLPLVSIIILHVHTDLVKADPMIAQCDEVKLAYVGMGYSPLDVPVSSIIQKGDDLEICPAGFSCCTRDMEIQLTSHSGKTYDERLVNATEPARRKLSSATTELHSFFTQQISKAEKETDDMFTRAYDKQYTQNKEVFDRLFNSFREYYTGADLDISQVIHQFFKDVFVKMFNLQNPTYNFTETFLTCVGNQMDSIGPFGTYPERLQRNLKQALMASRTFIQGLAIGRNVATAAQKVQPTVSCNKAHMKMNFCSHCRGLPSLKPCANYCLNVMKGCLSYHSELDQSWQRYIDAMDSLALRVAGDGSFNLESVLNPLKDQLSMAIMEYHQSSDEILERVLDSKTGCGVPPNAPTRDKRAVKSLGGTIPVRSRPAVALKGLVDSVKVTLRDVKYIWADTTLAGMMCSAISATTGSKCWNGRSEAIYSRALVGDGLQANRDNPEVEVDPSRLDPTINLQIVQLQAITARILNATSGIGSVAWVDLQVPLPNVTTSYGESRSVKSDARLQASQRSLFTLESSGSGYIEATDDEDYSHPFRSRPYLPLIPTDEMSGSGDASSTIAPDDTSVVVAPPSEKPEIVQPNIRPPAVTVHHRALSTSKPRRTTQLPPSSTNCVASSSSIILSSLVLILLLKHWGVSLIA